MKSEGGSWWQHWAPAAAGTVIVLGAAYALVARFNALEGQHTADCQQFARIETQFGIIETIINENHVRDKADLSALETKVFGKPGSAFYYEIKIPHDIPPC